MPFIHVGAQALELCDCMFVEPRVDGSVLGLVGVRHGVLPLDAEDDVGDALPVLRYKGSGTVPLHDVMCGLVLSHVLSKPLRIAVEELLFCLLVGHFTVAQGFGEVDRQRSLEVFSSVSIKVLPRAHEQSCVMPARELLAPG